MSDFEIKVTGLTEVQKAFKQLAPNLAQSIVRSALRVPANYLAKSIKANAPIKTGRLRKAVRVKTSKINTYRKNGIVGLFVTIYPGKTRQDPKGAWYGKFVEDGFNRGSKQVTGRQAVGLGIISQTRLNEKRAQVAAKRKFGKTRQKIRYRYGGKHVEGQHFIRDTFFAQKATTEKLLQASIEEVGKAVVKRMEHK